MRQSIGREDQEVFFYLVQDSFLSQHVLEATRGGERVRHNCELTEGFFLIMSRYVSHWDVVITTRYMLSSK